MSGVNPVGLVNPDSLVMQDGTVEREVSGLMDDPECLAERV